MNEHGTCLIRLRAAAFGYGSGNVLEGVDLDVHAGDFLGILGPNGAGKTTLFRGILGLLRPTEGTVERPGSPKLGYVPQRENLGRGYPLTVEEVVHMGAYGRLRGLRFLGRSLRREAHACLVRVGLGDRRRERFSTLSGGQRQRVLIARALLMEPDILLLDEPTSGVDRPAAKHILDLLAELNRERELAVLLVSHQTDLVRESAHEVVWVAGGGIRRGSADEMLDATRLEELFRIADDTPRTGARL